MFGHNRGADPWNEACGAEGTCKRVTSGPVPCSGARSAAGHGTGRSQRRDSARRSRAERRIQRFVGRSAAKPHRSVEMTGYMAFSSFASLHFIPFKFLYISGI